MCPIDPVLYRVVLPIITPLSITLVHHTPKLTPSQLVCIKLETMNITGGSPNSDPLSAWLSRATTPYSIHGIRTSAVVLITTS
jgi:hypothetical protein